MKEHLPVEDQKPPARSLDVEIPDELPILPIRNTVAFPGTIMPLTVGREKSLRLLEEVLGGDKLLGVVAQRSAKSEDPDLDGLYRVGTACRLLKLLKHPDDTETIIVHGICRIGLEHLVKTTPYWKAKVNPSRDLEDTSPEVIALIHNVRSAATAVIERSPNVPEEALMVLNNIDDAGGLADFLAANLSLGLVHKQEFLETFDVKDRLLKVNAALESQLNILQLSEKLQTEVRDQIDKSQREYYLHEQLKAIRKELGEDDGLGTELAELSQRVQQAKMPEKVEAEARREVQRMSKMSQGAPEYSVALDYVTWLCELPWSTATSDQLNLRKAARVLDQDHFGLKKVKQRILEFLAVRKLKPEGKGPILCFVGPPGVGKTSLGKSIARAMGRTFIRMSLGGVRDEAELRGHRRTYIGSMPGRIIQEIRKAESNNPVFMLDEVDKIGKDFRGDPASVLLEVLDPQQNDTFTDHYLSVPFNLSAVLFIATANYIDAVPPALLDRMEVISLSGYTQGEKLAIARKYLVPRQIEENGLKPEVFKMDDAAIKRIIEDYTREAGVRNLERQIGAVCRGAASAYADDDKKRFAVKSGDIEQYLGSPGFESDVVQRTATPGVVTGLAFTPVGGEILFVEATRMSGTGNLLLTGQVGSVMKESAQAAYSLIRSRGADWNLDDQLVAKSDLHIHVPAGAIPKDGPSAGVAMLLAMLSVFNRQVVPPDVAMTGEITLRGLVLPVGGIKEKVLAGYRAGVKTILLPRRNEKDLAEIPREVTRAVKFKGIDHIDQAIRLVFRPPARPAAARKPKRRTRKAVH